ncbi:unnamed protein product [Polarella glacialis]|uniref:Reverse transcriptase domain-containing protein n=1 Tax=Polarella glacialis TaxID=89957 RepID=A0A813D6L1_POLGL|nr:unnamed protein product [Polarella glacialis]CAE8626732.1 unnamed protein product [Polarella glacialis]|mmetsp:Transcript_62008/g.111617  ORF Transcript_62008/g.111617 Transcript_62008/m.111617 type:complete len:1128 (-) Transcript_62008:1304-4687(-)
MKLPMLRQLVGTGAALCSALSGQTHTTSRTVQQLSFSVYNPQAATTQGRVEQILESLTSDVVAIVGTQRVSLAHRLATHAGFSSQLPVERQNFQRHLVYHWGVAKGRFTTKACGVTLALNRRLFGEHCIKRFYHPPPALQGRGGALRVRTRWLDCCFLGGYAPNKPNNYQERQAVDAWFNWIDDVISQLPARCVPVLLADWNAHLGWEVRTTQPSVSQEVGIEGSARENYNGTQLRSLLQRHHMFAINSFSGWPEGSDTGPTYYSPGGNTSRIDYICLPQSSRADVVSCRVWRATGQELQARRSARLCDHCPVVVKINTHPFQPSPDSKRDRWAFPASQGAVREFQKEVQQVRSQPEVRNQFYRDLQTGDTMQTWMHLQETVQPIAKQHFTTQQQQPTWITDEVRQAFRITRLICAQLRAIRPSGNIRYDILQAWWTATVLAQADDRAKRIHRRVVRDRVTDIVKQLNRKKVFANLTDAWRLIRDLAGRELGPKNRVRGSVLQTLPSAEEWLQTCEQPGSQGGCAAWRLELFDLPFQWQPDGSLVITTSQPTADLDDELDIWGQRQQVQEDFQQVRKNLQKCPGQRSVPQWSMPAEIWKYLLLDDPHAPEAQITSDVQDFFFQIRRVQEMPRIWHHSEAALIPKGNDKQGTAAIRVVHKLDPLGRCFVKSLWQRGDHPSAPFSIGAVPRRRREQAILQLRLLLYRLHRLSVSTAFTKFDIRNAFPSTAHTALTEIVVNQSNKQDTKLLLQRHMQAATTIIAHNEEQLTVALGSGAMQGDSIAAQLFCQVFQQAVITLHCMLYRCCDWSRRCIVRDVATGAEVDVSFCTFVDDFVKVVPIEGVQDLIQKQQTIDSMFEQVLTPRGLLSHPTKKEIVPTVKGKGANTIMRHLLIDQPGDLARCALSACYLGAVFVSDDSMNAELDARIQAATKAWYVFRRIWKNGQLSLTVRLYLFKTMVVSALLLGQEASVFSPPQIARLETWRMKKLCQVVGKAYWVQSYTASHPIRRTAQAIRRIARSPTIGSELRRRRLMWMRHLARHPEDCAPLRALMFGKLPEEENEQLSPQGHPTGAASPWLAQWADDLTRLARADPRFPKITSLNRGIHELFLPSSPLANYKGKFKKNPHV